ncbi:type I-C CRISPR-associated protein Cas8c/Csd1 [Anaerococcus hydrogenalis]|uniref:Type I-C CRISPR-associated protein Cas8c/Csd1 n=1 Tax=Anaerococcus hydrogenalis TaxID=33029 RepID=A0A2N6UI07_9FIRM|nr:type I-C CRISPR-associated protein Cas8c/Csd1 [Anaerococcus hydrogenalis]MDK7695370.1 type I-C CRISPR-associated protein Cas8c/Csd1 [Anaerococcus hydrogenalis]MDK7697129.1 type I-C CRISPR-associated protein Cas8c/Csd1 [Anaerococcus hydrogenalis]MDK7708350.1 type I-C CRISPR-associated protein Cas8c/Csd1 [Anaerococcus hydrogenalis]PMC81174.1 type I-C CRISPR-associated protein Cas8c/Csd1 [Anaerococcus hydrogenalis]
MSLLQALYNSYEYAKNNNMIDKYDSNDIILPLYHDNKKSNGKNIVSLKINKDSNLVDAYFLNKDDNIIFSVTEDSVARSSGASPHPLVDNGSYLFDIGSKKNVAYMNQLKDWLDYSGDDFLNIVYKFLSNSKSFLEIIDKLYVDYEIKGNLTISIDNPNSKNNKKKDIDFSKIFFTFTIEDYDGLKDMSLNENHKLHEIYLQYINHLNKKDSQREKIICNISGKEDYLCTKHRPLMATARLISQITANNENFYGRFKSPDETIKIGANTSQEIHLMAKYLLSSENTSVWLGDNTYLVNWFSDDIKNETCINLNSRIYKIRNNISNTIGGEKNKEVGESFLKGKILFSDDSKYYVGIFDKISNGRTAAKYFKELDVSILKENLQKWQNKYFWYGFNKKINDEIIYTPSPYTITLVSYGVERSGKISIDNKKILRSQMQNIISCIIEGKDIGDNIVKSLEKNIKSRIKYKDTWNTVKNTSLSILRYKWGIKDNMLDKENLDRSYLYGRLLALYERVEKLCFETKDKDNQVTRITNAEKYWTSFINNPVTINLRLRDAIKPYERKLAANENKKRIYFKIKNEINEVTNLIADNYDYRKEENRKALSSGFIFGYEGQIQEIFTKKENKEQINDK